MLSREQINNYYQGALEYFRNNYPQFVCTIEQNAFIVQLNIFDEKYYNVTGLTQSARSYRCIVKILPNGKFCMADVFSESDKAIGLGGISIYEGAFAGRSYNVHYDVNLNKNDETGKIEFQREKFSTLDIQKPVKEYFKSLGLKYKFYSYTLNVKSLPKPIKIVSVIVPLFVGVLFIPLSFVFGDDKVGVTVFLITGTCSLLWGLINLIILLRKDE